MNDTLSSLKDNQTHFEAPSESTAEQPESSNQEASAQGYFDAETSEKCIKVSKSHEEFQLDLKQRQEKTKTDVQAYDTRLQELINAQQSKVMHHSNKLTVVWQTVSKT